MKSNYHLCPFCTDKTTCARHQDKGIKKDKKVYTIPKKSNKKKDIDKELAKMYPVFLAEPDNHICKLKMNGCLGKATAVHHVRGRIGDQVFEVKDWLPCCVFCNVKVEEKDKEARDRGLKKSKFYK